MERGAAGGRWGGGAVPCLSGSVGRGFPGVSVVGILTPMRPAPMRKGERALASERKIFAGVIVSALALVWGCSPRPAEFDEPGGGDWESVERVPGSILGSGVHGG